MKFGVADLISRQPLPHHGACIPFSQPPPSNLFFPLPSAPPPPSGRSLESVQSAALLWRNHTPSDITTHVASTSPRGQRPPSVLLFLFFPLVFSVNYSQLSIERIERICEFVESVPVVRIRARINEYRCFFFFGKRRIARIGRDWKFIQFICVKLFTSRVETLKNTKLEISSGIKLL